MIQFVQLDEDQPVPREIIEMGSRNHSRLQPRIAYIVEERSGLVSFTELSLDASHAPFEELDINRVATLIPDVAFYKSIDIDWFADEVKMGQMPLVAVEILSPYQGSQEFLNKFRLYFALGVKSCWLVNPAFQSIAVFSQDMKQINYTSNETLYDENVGVSIDLSEIFRN